MSTIGEYRAWFRAEHRVRLAACCLTFAIGLLLLSCSLQFIFTFQVFGSFKNLGFISLLVVAQLALLLARCMILTVEARTEPCLLRLRFYLSSPMHYLVGILFAVSAVTTCKTLLEITQRRLSEASASVLDHDRVFAFGAIIVFAVWSAAASSSGHLLSFPSLQQGRWMRIQNSVLKLTVSAWKCAAKFTAVWYVIYWVVSWIFPELLARLVRMLVSPGIGPQTFELTSGVGLSTGLLLCFLLVVTDFCWKMGLLLLDIFVTEVVPFDQFLLFGLTDTDRLAKYHAFRCLLEISPLSQELSVKDREGIYGRVPFYAPTDKNSAWQVVSQSSVQVLNALVDAICAELGRPTPVGRGWLVRDPDQKMAFLFRDLQLQCWSAQALSYLVAFSLEEDEKGCVQQSLPGILATLLDCTIVLEELHKRSKHKSNQPHPGILSETLDNVLYRIVTTFYDQLDNLVLSDRHARRLREYTQFAR